MIPAPLLHRIANELPLRIIDHEGRPYLRRYYVGTAFGIRCYLHHFVDSDPAGLHSHPWRFGVSILLYGRYVEETRFGFAEQKWINFVNGDKFHRVVVSGRRPWSLFLHSRKVATWGTLKDKGIFTQYVEERPENYQLDGHSQWHLTARKGKDILREIENRNNASHN